MKRPVFVTLQSASFYIRLYKAYSGYMATTIQLEPETREMLKAIGGKGETYDGIIRDLIAAYEARLAELENRLKAPRKEFVPLDELKQKWGIK
jgi:hypothetical protein